MKHTETGRGQLRGIGPLLILITPFILHSGCAEDLPEAAHSACETSSSLGSPVLDGLATPKHLIGISIDTLRRDAVGRYNSTVAHTDFLDGLLAESVALDNHRSCSNWTFPAMACAFTGQSTRALQIDPVHDLDSLNAIGDYLPTFTETLQTAGFTTSLVSASKLVSSEYALGTGFDRTIWVPELNTAEEIVDATLGEAEYLQSLGNAPFYLHIHLLDPHSPLSPPDKYQGELAGTDLGEYDPRTEDGGVAIATQWKTLEPTVREKALDNMNTLYRGEVAYLDDQLERLWTQLDNLGILDDAFVFILSDHGEQFQDHGEFYHERSLHPEENRAIAALWQRGLSAQSYTGPTQHEDFAPTVLSHFGVEVPTAITGEVIGTESPSRARVTTGTTKLGVPIQAIDRYEHRLIYTWDGSMEYFRLDLDHTEQENRYDKGNEDVACLWAELQPEVEKVSEERAGMVPEGI